MEHNNARVRKVAITGISGYFGRALLPLLEQDETVERVVGIDCRPLSVRPSEKVQFYLKDVRDPALGELLQGAEVLVHADCLQRKTEAGRMGSPLHNSRGPSDASGRKRGGLR